MTPDELAALAAIRGLASANRVRITSHASREARHAGVENADVFCALRTAAACKDQRRDATTAADWKVTGRDRDGDELHCAVTIEGEVVVVTVF
jgi:hypothetical protein